MVVILLGPPGVGKGTQGEILTDELGWVRISTGDLLRAARKEGTELGQEAQKYMDAGELVPDDLIMAMVEEQVEALDPDTGIVFDGFPRTIAQAEGLDQMLPKFDRRIDRVVVLDAPDETLVKRIAGRRSCPECGCVYNIHFSPPEEEGVCDRCGSELTHRADDTPETVQHRLDVYREETEPLIRYYREGDPLVTRVDADQSVDAVQDEVLEAAGADASEAGE